MAFVPVGCHVESLDHLLNQLTPRERDVLACLLRGEANKDIAVSLGCSVRTVEFHVSNVLRKIGVPSRAKLAAMLLHRTPAIDPRSSTSS